MTASSTVLTGALRIPTAETLHKLRPAYLSVLEILHKHFPDDHLSSAEMYRDLDTYHGLFGVYASLFYKPRNIMEIGVRTGTSLLPQMFYNPNGRYVGFDLFQTSQGLELSVDRIKRYIEILNLPSVDCTFVQGDTQETLGQFLSDNPGLYFDYISIDGGHTYEACYSDLTLASKALSTSGIMVVDDVATTALSHAGLPQEVGRALNAFMSENPRLRRYTYALNQSFAVVCRRELELVDIRP